MIVKASALALQKHRQSIVVGQEIKLFITEK